MSGGRSGFPWEPWLAVVVGVMVLAAVVDAARAAERRVTPAVDLQRTIEQAAPGEVLTLAPGVYAGNLILNKPITLQGEAGAILDAGGVGDVVRVRAPNVSLRGLVIRRSGQNLTQMNAGIFVEENAGNITIENNRLELNAFGIWLDGAAEARVSGNRIAGDPSLRSQDRGNGIHLFNVRNAEVAGNEVRQTRDGIYIELGDHNLLRDNELHHLRYGVHYMFSHHNELRGNFTHDTRTGYALMQSKFLRVTGNRSERDQNYGILLNYITGSTLAGNRIIDVLRGTSPGVPDSHGIPGAEGKAIFLYNSTNNRLHGNVFHGAEIGIHLTAGSEDNAIYGNSFIDNRVQVKYVANRFQEWSVEGRGNYWSDYLGWDLDADGIGDQPYEPNDAVDVLLWKYPAAKLLMHSPAIQTLRWVQREFPVLRPPGVRDSAPLMTPPYAEPPNISNPPA